MGAKRRDRRRGRAVGGTGDDLLFRGFAPPVASAQAPFTTVFGMGTGGSTPLTTPAPRAARRVARGGSVVGGTCRGRRAHSWVRAQAQTPSAISTGRLRASRPVHPPPIEQLVLLRPYALKGLGCLILGSVSRLDAFSASPLRTSATRLCPWQGNRHTGGPSAPVLSY